MKKVICMLLSSLFILNIGMAKASAAPLEDIRKIIRDHYVDEVPESVLQQKTLGEITKHLDPHSVYMTAEEYKGFINAIEQRIVGIGIVLEEDLKGIKVTSVIAGGPAQRAGILPGDVITHVDGKSIVDKSVQIAVSLISGTEKTIVKLEIVRQGLEKPLMLTLTREEIFLPNVESRMLGGNIGYIRLNSFATESAREINKAIQSLSGAEGWIVDLRNNGGGFITVAQEVTGFFPNTKNAFQIRERNKAPVTYPVVVQSNQLSSNTHILINEFSASASEMVSASVKEQKSAMLYGHTSYGKGTMQSMFSFDDGSVLKMTTARFFSPGGVAVDKVGVKPDTVTEKGAELEVSHRDHLLAKLTNYKQLPKLGNVSVTKKFTLEMNRKMDFANVNRDAIQLIQLGGAEQEVTVRVVNEKTISVIPKNPLTSGGKYVLIIHPLWKDQQKKSMKQGVYLDVVVK